jgi:hypothetical protein
MTIQMVFEFMEPGFAGGAQRAERLVDLSEVPRVGETVWVAKLLSMRVKGVSWLWEGEDFPSLWMERSEGTTSAVKQLEPTLLEIPSNYVDDLRTAGWSVDIP